MFSKLKKAVSATIKWLGSPPLCQIGRHEYVLSIDDETTTLHLKCMHCRRETPGWNLSRSRKLN